MTLEVPRENAFALGLDVHLHLHQHDDRTTYEALQEILCLLRKIRKTEEIEMSVLDDLRAQVDAVGTNVQAETDAVTAVEALVDQLVGITKDVQTKLDAAIQAGDPAAIQAASDALKAANDAMAAKTAELAAKTLANTPAAPNP